MDVSGGAQINPQKYRTQNIHMDCRIKPGHGKHWILLMLLLLFIISVEQNRERQFAGKTLKWFAFNTYSFCVCFFYSLSSFHWLCVFVCAKFLHIIWVHCETIHILQYCELKCTKKKCAVTTKKNTKKRGKQNCCTRNQWTIHSNFLCTHLKCGSKHTRHRQR